VAACNEREDKHRIRLIHAIPGVSRRTRTKAVVRQTVVSTRQRYWEDHSLMQTNYLGSRSGKVNVRRICVVKAFHLRQGHFSFTGRIGESS
jgi:hypothetical protein